MKISSVFMLLLAQACASSQGRTSDAGDTTDGGAPISAYEWRATWGPCPPDSPPCGEQYLVTRAGAVTHLQGATSNEAALTSSDVVSFNTFLDDPGLVAAVSDSRACPLVLDRVETVVLTFDEGRPSISKSVLGCTGPVFDRIENWTQTFASYFP